MGTAAGGLPVRDRILAVTAWSSGFSLRSTRAVCLPGRIWKAYAVESVGNDPTAILAALSIF